jgi:hypothetical protein
MWWIPKVQEAFGNQGMGLFNLIIKEFIQRILGKEAI